jgi:transcriptional regulator with XRE-family HTH domain
MSPDDDEPADAGEDGRDSELTAFTSGADDEAFAINLRRYREIQAMSQGELARRMGARGFPFYQQTVRRIEEGRRKVSVGEGKVLAAILGATLEDLTQPTPELDAAQAVLSAASRLQNRFEEAAGTVRMLLNARATAEKVLAETEGTEWPRVRAFREMLAERLDLHTLDNAVAKGIMQHEEISSKEGDGDMETGEA